MQEKSDAVSIHVEEYIASRNAYLQSRKDLFRDSAKPRGPAIFLKVVKVVTNSFRYSIDLFRKIKRRKTLIDVNNVHLIISVTRREAFITSTLFESLYFKKRNHRPLQAFMEQELFQEVQCSHFLVLEGISVDEFHILLEHLGHNPRAFFSDDRGENGGRVAIDNALIGGVHPLLSIEDPDYKEELKYWQPVFPLVPKNSIFAKWMTSRTHGVVYTFDVKGDHVLIIPIHVDPKNVVMMFREAVHKNNFGSPTLSYHQIPVGEKEYVGTGLYRLGCHLFIHMIKNAQQIGLIRSLTLSGDMAPIVSEVSIIQSECFARKIRDTLTHRLLDGRTDS